MLAGDAAAGTMRPVQLFLDKWLYRLGLRSAKDLSLPDFLCIGAQKAGTTWLHENLRQHPDLYLPPAKELHYFDRFYWRPFSSYADCFRPGDGKVKGEITPAYGVLPASRIRFIHRVMPQVRLILILRNPIDRAWSMALMRLVTRPKRMVEQVSADEFLDHLRSERSITRGTYSRMLDRWLAVFPPEQLYIGFFQDIIRRPQAMLEDVFRHLGVQPPRDWSSFPCHRIIHAGPSVAIPPACRQFLQELYGREIELLHQRFGAPVAAWFDNEEG